jgi:hypothetical protein
MTNACFRTAKQLHFRVELFDQGKASHHQAFQKRLGLSLSRNASFVSHSY